MHAQLSFKLFNMSDCFQLYFKLANFALFHHTLYIFYLETFQLHFFSNNEYVDQIIMLVTKNVENRSQ